MPTLFEQSKTPMPPITPDPDSIVPPESIPALPSNPPKHDPMHLFTAYAERPNGVKFETQQDDEDVVIFMRQHFALNIPWIFATILLALAPFTIIPFFFSIVQFPIPIPARYGMIGFLFWYLATFGYALLNFIRWYYNIYIVTTERVIDIDFIQLLYKKFSEARLDKIEDVTYSTSGFFAAVFNFGDVTIQTAGEAREFDFENIPKPAEVVKIIEKMIDKQSPLPHP